MSDFMQPGDIDISTMLSTTDWPTCTAAQTHIVGDYNSVQVTVSGEEEGEESGVYFYLCDEEKCMFVEVFSGSHNSCVLKLVDGKWVSDDQTVVGLHETNRQLVAENERRSAKIASLKSQRPEPLLNEQFRNLILKAQQQGVALKYFDGIAWQSVNAAPYIE